MADRITLGALHVYGAGQTLCACVRQRTDALVFRLRSPVVIFFN